ncbi:hypothetical protein MyNCGM121_39450 [Achromobacter xylosoxidans]|uniref:hypothetical protein n=1 Tax=Alcaligenes xylosoxydans xylosoxydans TaxID=85698 RepID=UPI001F0D73A8|nr:hypothetical protein [Achromobacter xylosoxidans]MCH4591113.1 hypothetical protein [Achromobacter xylosoxidans]MDZ5625623.1 hypothetical protein [Achromobacter xylosoxidans]
MFAGYSIRESFGRFKKEIKVLAGCSAAVAVVALGVSWETRAISPGDLKAVVVSNKCVEGILADRLGRGMLVRENNVAGARALCEQVAMQARGREETDILLQSQRASFN